MSFLAIDVGNTRLKWAYYAQAQPGSVMLEHGATFLESIDNLAESQWQNLPQPQAILGCVVAGPGVQRRVEEQLGHWQAEPQWVVPSQQACGVFNGYDHPSRLGSDRWAALIGAYHHPVCGKYESGAVGDAFHVLHEKTPGRSQVFSPPSGGDLAQSDRSGGGALRQPLPTLVVMVGTAVTVDALDSTGRFLGGVILPGFGLMMRALELSTAGLKAPTGEVCDFPTQTGDALISGAAQAIAGAVDRLYDKLRIRCAQTPRLLITGGAVTKLTPLMNHTFEVVETLIFDGLLQIQAQRASIMKNLFATHFSMELTG